MGGLTSHWPVSAGVLDEVEKGEKELCQYNNNNNTDNIHIGQCTHIPESTIVNYKTFIMGALSYMYRIL
jgi:hypothetical protein